MTERKRTVGEKVGAVLISFVAAGGAAFGVQAWKANDRANDYRAAGFPSQQSYTAYREEWRKLESVPEYTSWKAKQGAGDVFNAAAQLSKDGIPRLGETDLQTRLEIMLRVMQNQNSAMCAFMVRGTGMDMKSATSALLDSVERFGGPDASRRWAGMSVNAAIASLKKYPLPSFTDDTINKTFVNVLGKESQRNKDLVLDLMLRPGAMNDRDACDAGTIMFRSTLAAKPPDKLNMLRILVME